MSQKYDPLKHQRQSIRLPEWDYRGAGYYFVTICTHQRVHLFADGDFYDVAYFAWQNIPTRNHAQQIVLDEFCVLPNHIHGIIIRPEDETVLLETPEEAPPVFQNAAAGSLGVIVGNYKSLVTRRINNLRRSPGNKVWQRGYYERIIRNERELNAIRHYIRENPRRWAEDRDNLDALLPKMNLIIK